MGLRAHGPVGAVSCSLKIGSSNMVAILNDVEGWHVWGERTRGGEGRKKTQRQIEWNVCGGKRGWGKCVLLWVRPEVEGETRGKSKEEGVRSQRGKGGGEITRPIGIWGECRGEKKKARESGKREKKSISCDFNRREEGEREEKRKEEKKEKRRKRKILVCGGCGGRGVRIGWDITAMFGKRKGRES